MRTTAANPELAQAAKDAAAGMIDPLVADEACRHMDQAREQIRKRVGELNIAVDLIRQVREE